jgi:serine/threonine protein phosphatase PrpC
MPRIIDLHVTSQQGRRDANEDVERYFLNLSPDGTAVNKAYAPVDFFVVCDGHGGSLVARFVVPLLEKYFMDRNNVYPLTQNFIFKMYDHIQKQLVYHPEKIANMCGCTAIVVVRYLDKYFNEFVQVVNIGDCRAVLSREGLAIPLSKDHKPFWSDEKHRIDAVNKRLGTNQLVHFEAGDWRIGDLSVSRSFGDLDNTPYVTHLPDTYRHRLERADEFIIIACDGLWDVLQNHEAINFVRDHMNKNNIKYYEIDGRYPSKEVERSKCIARKLASYAIARGSMDNVSVMIIFLEKNNN